MKEGRDCVQGTVVGLSPQLKGASDGHGVRLQREDDCLAHRPEAADSLLKVYVAKYEQAMVYSTDVVELGLYENNREMYDL